MRAHSHVLNKANKATGLRARRGDGTFGERTPSSLPQTYPGLSVARAAVATIEIGVEVKIITKAMIRQAGRVCTDMRDQVDEFRKHHKDAICVGIVGINHARTYTSYEAERVWATTGKGKHLHPFQQASAVEQYVLTNAGPKFDELVVLRFDATNLEPYPFSWVDATQTEAEYSAALVRLSRLYETRF